MYTELNFAPDYSKNGLMEHDSLEPAFTTLSNANNLTLTYFPVNKQITEQHHKCFGYYSVVTIISGCRNQSPNIHWDYF